MQTLLAEDYKYRTVGTAAQLTNCQRVQTDRHKGEYDFLILDVNLDTIYERLKSAK